MEDLKDKVKEQNKPDRVDPSEVEAKLRAQGLDPETFTLKDLFHEVLDADGSDLTLMSATEFEVMKTYRKTRKYLAETYPQPQQPAVMPELYSNEEEEPYDINIKKAAADPQSRIFLNALYQIMKINEKVRELQFKATEYEKTCVRLYGNMCYTWNSPPGESYREILEDREVFEIVEAYFKICRKYGVPTFEEPYYFLSGKQRQRVKLEGDMLKRTTDYSDSDFEIRVSILEDFS